MSVWESHINPCFCISLRAGAVVVSIYDIIFGVAYIFRDMYIEYLRNSFREYFPADFPNPTGSEFVFQMSRRGNYISVILSGLALLFATNYLRFNYSWLSFTCYIWLMARGLLIISYSIFCNALLESYYSHFNRLGYELLVNIFVNLYFMLVVAAFIRETRIELNNYRAIKPINIEQGEHEEYLRNDRESKFNDATSYHFMSPSFFLNAGKNKESRANYNLQDTHVDDSLLQYVIVSSKVGTVSEAATRDPKRKSILVKRELDADSMMTTTDDDSKTTLLSGVSLFSAAQTSNSNDGTLNFKSNVGTKGGNKQVGMPQANKKI